MTPGAITFIHLSDIHFQHYENTQLDIDNDLRNELVLDAVSMIEQTGSLDGVFVTGDVAYRGQKNEYETSSEWLGVLCAKLRCKPENVWVIPGNHDVHRATARGSKVIKSIHSDIHECSVEYVDAVLSEWMSDAEGMEALFRPIEAFNEFASKFGCSSTPKAPCWSHDLPLNDGSKLRLYGINSTLSSGTLDNEKGKLVVGALQSSRLLREEGVSYIVMCHHPCDWLLDGDTVADGLNARAVLQLFGHKHRQRMNLINNSSLIVGAGAVQPSRTEADWKPIYNIIQLYVELDGKNRSLVIKVWPRIWNEERRKFFSDFDEEGSILREFKIVLPKWQPQEQHRIELNAHNLTLTTAETNDENVNPVIKTDGDKPMYTERRLVFRFLGLPYSRIVKIAAAMDLVSDDDKMLSESLRKQQYFLRAKERNVLVDLQEHVERNHLELHPATDSQEANVSGISNG